MTLAYFCRVRYIYIHLCIGVSDNFCWRQASLAQLEMENPQLEDRVCVFFLKAKTHRFIIGDYSTQLCGDYNKPL